MLAGKYWLMPNGVVDVTNSEHALYAKNYLLGLVGTKDQLVLAPAALLSAAGNVLTPFLQPSLRRSRPVRSAGVLASGVGA